MTVTTRTRCLRLSLLLITLLIATLLTSCGQASDGDAAVTDGTVLNVYNWGEYISDGSEGSYNTNREFEEYYYRKYGVRVKVNYTTYATNEDMYSKLKSGAGTYDIIIPSDYMIQKMKDEDMLYAFDPNELENYQYIDSAFKNLYYDPDNCYSVPYTYGVVGIIYNTTMIDEEDVAEASWGLLWNEKYRGKILQFNNPRDGLGSAMYYLGLDVNSTDTATWDRALSKLLEQKPLVQGYVSDEIFNKMISGSAAAAPYYAGDYVTMADQNEALAFYYPTEGTNVFVDAMCIPKNARQKELAKEYINFMLSEDAAVANAEYIGYASPNRLVRENTDYQDSMGEDAIAILYDTDGLNATYPYDPYFHSFTADIQDYTNTLWENLKTESSTELWVHITSATIVGALLCYGAYLIYIRKKRSREYRYRDRELARRKAGK